VQARPQRKQRRESMSGEVEYDKLHLPQTFIPFSKRGLRIELGAPRHWVIVTT
jgi:hypothetical protein